MASSVGAGDARRAARVPPWHGWAGRSAGRPCRARQILLRATDPAGSVALAGDSERPKFAMQTRRTGTKDVLQTCDPVLLSASHSAARAAVARRSFQVEATGRQHVVRRPTCALAGPRLRDRALSGNLIHSRVKNESCNLNMLIRTRYFRTTSEIMYPAMRARQAIGTATDQDREL